MLSIHEHASLEDASRELLDYILVPTHWVHLPSLKDNPSARPGQHPDYQCRVGPLRICASVDVTGELEVFLRVAFRAPGLTPLKAADHLADFLRTRMPLTPNTEWQVEVDERNWIHFMRRYTGGALQA
jgi:hypothetical protein